MLAIAHRAQRKSPTLAISPARMGLVLGPVD
jgi:hypothetical protein